MTRPFDAARYSGMLEGLEVTELLLSEVRKANDKLRIDSGYFAKPMLAADLKVRGYAGGHDELGALFSRFVKGVFDINADSYSDCGVPFLRILNLRYGVIDDLNLALIPQAIHETEKKTELLKGDIVLSKTAYPAASVVTLKRCNTSQDTVATRLSSYGKATYTPEALVAYLNSSLGERLLWRQFQGNVQLHLSLDDGRKVPVPRFGAALQSVITDCFDLAQLYRDTAKASQLRIEQALMSALGLSDWQAPQLLSCVRSSADVFAAARLDAEYFQEQYVSLNARLRAFKGGHVTLGDICPTPVNGVEIREYEEVGVPYLRVGDIRQFSISPDNVKFVAADSASKEIEKVRLRAGDVLVSRSGSLAVTGVVEAKWAHALISSHLIRVRLTDERLDPYYVAAFLAFMPGKMQIEQQSNGGVQPEISQPSLKRVVIPLLGASDQRKVRNAINDANAASGSARALFGAAKCAVEIAIEDSEAAAIAYLEAQKGIH